MVDKVLKAKIRAELFRSALSGRFQTYTQFYNSLRPGDVMGNFPYQTHFNEIAKEERELGYPDVTFMVHGVGGYPHQIDFEDARRGPTGAQLRKLQDGTDEVLNVYCPGAKNRYRGD